MGDSGHVVFWLRCILLPSLQMRPSPPHSSACFFVQGLWTARRVMYLLAAVAPGPVRCASEGARIEAVEVSGQALPLR